MFGVTNPDEKSFKDGVWGHDGSVWRKLALLWGYTDHWSENLGATKEGDGTYTKTSTAVPAGYVYVVSVISLVNGSGSRGQVNISVVVSGVTVFLHVKVTPAVNIPELFSGNLVLGEGDYVEAKQYSCLNNDVILAGVVGYKMKVT